MGQQATGLAEQRDTEITLGTGKLLVIFLVAAIVCGIFFGLGFNLGRASTPQPDPNVVAAAPLNASATAPKPSATHAVGQVSAPPPDSSAPANPSVAPQTTLPPEIKPAAANTEPPALSGAFVVQVAAVTHREDAEALTAALKQKGYPVFIVSDAPDKLFHVQVGPFSDRKDATAMRDRLSAEGYNPIVK